MNSCVDLIAKAAFGLEPVVAAELRSLGFDGLQLGTGRIDFKAAYEDIPRLNLWLRTSDRVVLRLGEFRAITFDELFERTKALPWADWLPKDAEFPVEGKSVQSQLFSVSDCQAIVKKAIVEKLKQKYRVSWFQESGPRYRIEVALLKDIVTLTLDTSGAGLNKRGYRAVVGSAAPLRETLAAAILHLIRWNGETPLIDPFCGSGTIPIEAALIASNRAPGLYRNFDSELWPFIPSRFWADAREQATAAVNRSKDFEITGWDIDGEAITFSQKNAVEAGVADIVRFGQRPVKELASDLDYGSIVCNPPYGERLGTKSEVAKLYKEMGRAFSNLGTWSYTVLTAHRELEKLMGLWADKKRKVYNGQIECTLYQFFGPKRPS